MIIKNIVYIPKSYPHITCTHYMLSMADVLCGVDIYHAEWLTTLNCEVTCKNCLRMIEKSKD